MSERIFTAEQIKVPAELPALLKDLAKEAIRTDPTGGKKGPDARKALAAWAAEMSGGGVPGEGAEDARFFYELTVAALQLETQETETAGERELMEEMLSVWKLLVETSGAQGMVELLEGALRWLHWRFETLEDISQRASAFSLFSELRRGDYEAAIARLVARSGASDGAILRAVVEKNNPELVRVARRAVQNGARGELVAFTAGLGMEEFVDSSTDAFEVLWMLVWSLRQQLLAEGCWSSAAAAAAESSHEAFLEVVTRMTGRRRSYLAEEEPKTETEADCGRGRLWELQSALVFNLSVESILESILALSSVGFTGKTDAHAHAHACTHACMHACISSPVHAFLGYLGVYLRSLQGVFDPEVTEKVDVLIERQIMSFFAAKGANIGSGRAAVFLAEHVVQIFQAEVRTKVWAGCFLELAHLPGPPGATGATTLVRELVERETDFENVVAVLKHLVEEAVSLAGTDEEASVVHVAVKTLGAAILQSLRKFVHVVRSPYGVFTELIDRLAMELMLGNNWLGLENLVYAVDESLDVAVLLATSPVPEFLKFAQLCFSFGAATPGQELVIEDVISRLQLTTSPCPPVACHSQEEQHALSHGILFLLKKLVSLLGRLGPIHTGRTILVEALVPACEESLWLADLLGDRHWAVLGQLTDAVIAQHSAPHL